MTPRNVLETGFLPEDFEIPAGYVSGVAIMLMSQDAARCARIANALLEQAKVEHAAEIAELKDRLNFIAHMLTPEYEERIILCEGSPDEIGAVLGNDARDETIAKHEQALKDAVRVYARHPDSSEWTTWAPGTFPDRVDTHTGLLINVEKIGAKDGE